MPVIDIQDLHYAYPPLLAGDAPTPVLRGVNLSVARGEFLALMGPTGAGKTTLCMALNGLVPQSTGGVIRGQVTVLGQDTRRTPVAELATRVGLVFQDPESQLFCTTVEDEVAFGPENLGLPRAEIAERVAWALDAVGATDYRVRVPTQLSGGQQQRVAIAASLAMLPEVLLLDEPTSGLDPVGQREVLAVIERLARQHSMTIVLATQDAEQVAELADRLAVLWQGQIVRADEPRRVFQEADLLQQVGIAAPQVSELAAALNRRCCCTYHFVRMEEAERALGQALQTSSICHSEGCTQPEESRSRRWEMLREYPQQDRAGFLTLPPPASSPPCVRIEGLSHHYEPGVPALNDLDLEIADGTFLAIMGQNGSGKTTLVKHLNGLLKPTAGRVWVYGQETTTVTVSHLARQVGYVFQNPDHQLFCASTREELSFGPRNLGLSADVVRERAEEALQAFELLPYADIPPAVLGFGLRRKVSIAAVYAMRPRLFILDEPTAGLEWQSAQDLLQRMARLHAAGHTVILVTHDMRLAAQYAQEMLLMHAGRVLAQGTVRAVLGHIQALQQAQVMPPQVMRLGRALAAYGFPQDLLTVDEFCQAYARLAPPAGCAEAGP